MPRDRLLLTEILEAGDRIIDLVAGRDAADFEANRDLRDALLWNFTVLGEASSQVSQDLKDAHPEVGWSNPRADAQPNRPWLLVLRSRRADVDRRGGPAGPPGGDPAHRDGVVTANRRPMDATA